MATLATRCFPKSEWIVRLGQEIWSISSCSSESALTMWESSDVRKGNCNKEEEVEEKQMRLRDEKRDHLFQTLITLLPCSSVSPSPWSSSSPTRSITFYLFILILMSSQTIRFHVLSPLPHHEKQCILKWAGIQLRDDFRLVSISPAFDVSNALLLIVGESPSLDLAFTKRGNDLLFQSLEPTFDSSELLLTPTQFVNYCLRVFWFSCSIAFLLVFCSKFLYWSGLLLSSQQARSVNPVGWSG